MKKNIEDYVFHKRNFLTERVCKEGIINLEESAWDKHTWKTYEQTAISPAQDMEPVFKDSDSEVTDKITFLNDFIIEELFITIKEYVNSLELDWFTDWSGYSSIKFIKYSLGETMVDHWDSIHSLFDGERKGVPTLSIIGTLNDDYEGGEFYMFKDKKIDMKAGDLLIFPSTFMYPHRVQPIKKGARYSYVSWTW